MTSKLLQHRLLWDQRNAAHDKMVSALRELVAPKLREAGFRGSFPHYCRQRDQTVDLASFQFGTGHGLLAVTVGYCEVTGFTDIQGKHVPAERVRPDDLPHKQWVRLGSRPPEIADHWFNFESEDASVIASTIVSLLRSQAERFWHERNPSKE